MRKQDKDRNGKPEALLWVDVETTGVDRDLANCWRSGCAARAWTPPKRTARSPAW